MSSGLLSSINKLIFAKVCENVNFNNICYVTVFLAKGTPVDAVELAELVMSVNKPRKKSEVINPHHLAPPAHEQQSHYTNSFAVLHVGYIIHFTCTIHYVLQ